MFIFAAFAYVSSECQKQWTEAVLQVRMAKKLQRKGLEDGKNPSDSLR